jgi:tRNA G10  N-methylase Trm11
VTLLDPCCGSGTIPCIAHALGMHTVWGSDLQEDFLEKVGTSQ